MGGLFGTLARGAEYKSTDASALTWAALLGQPSSKAGVAVNIETALRVSTVFGCCRVLGEGIAQLPLNLFEVNGNSSKLSTDPLQKLISLRPNDFMTSFEMRETMMYRAVLGGNAYAYLGRGGLKRSIQEIVPLHNPCRPVFQGGYNLLGYKVDNLEGEVIDYEPDEILHLRGPSWDGLVGMDAIRLARESIGLAIATEETHSRLFSNGARPGGLLSVDGSLSKESKDALKQRIADQQEGLHNQFKTLVLDQAAKWQTMAMTGVDAQHLDTRRFQIEEVCRAMRVFPQMVMHSDKASTFASAEQFFIAHVTHSLMPWGTRLTQRIDHTMLADRPNMMARLAYAALMFGDAAARSTYYQNALGGARGETAYMTRNEVRLIESSLLGISLDPIEGGDTVPTATPPVAPIGGPDVKPQLPHLDPPTPPATVPVQP